MKDSYDQLDWQNGSAAQGYTNYSADDYDQYAQNPTYRNDFYEGADAGYADTYQQGYDQQYDTTYQDNTFQDAYQQNYQSYDNSYQQTQSTYNDPRMATGPVKYSQADYDNMAQNPSYIDDPNRMDADSFFNMVHEQDRRKQRQEQIAMFALTSKTHHLYRSGDDSDYFDKDVVLYLFMCAFGAALARLFNLPLWLYPLFATIIAYGITLVKKIVIDNTPPRDALKLTVIEGALVVVGLIASLSLCGR